MRSLILLSALLLSSTHVHASGAPKRATAHNVLWAAECGTCHVAYPPHLLSADSWRAVINGLDRHFGSDASLDPAKAQEILDFLQANSGRRDTSGPGGKPLLRVTDTRWFAGKHDEVPASRWKHAQVKGPANCGACHTQAETGDYSERNIRMPR